MNETKKTRKKIEFELPSKEELEEMEAVGIDFEAEALRAFREELHFYLDNPEWIC